MASAAFLILENSTFSSRRLTFLVSFSILFERFPMFSIFLNESRAGITVIERIREKKIPVAVKIAKPKRGRIGLVMREINPTIVVIAERKTAFHTSSSPSIIVSRWISLVKDFPSFSSKARFLSMAM